MRRRCRQKILRFELDKPRFAALANYVTGKMPVATRRGIGFQPVNELGITAMTGKMPVATRRGIGFQPVNELGITTMPGKIRCDEETRTIAVFESDLGWIAVGWVFSRLARLTFGHRSPKSAHAGIEWFDVSPQDPAAWMRKTLRRIQRFTSGEEDDFLDIELDLPKSTAFQSAVIASCRRIPFGQTLSYGELASQAGYPRAARAVGNVMSTNRIPLIIPCHRVVGSAGSLGGYSARDGLKMKRRLLALEGAM